MRDRYTITERLDHGGMAEVFRGVAESMEGFKKSVAIKRILPNLTKNQKFVSMFLDEARLSLFLQHANIVAVFDISKTADNAYFLVMEYVDGIDLGVLQRGLERRRARLPLDLVLHLGAEICDALDHAQQTPAPDGRPMNLVHRDVSPSNVLVTSAGRVKLIDLGVARSESAEHATSSGLIKGKYGYMAPEVMQGAPFDRRADVFSVGVLAWELVTIRKLFPVNQHAFDLDRVRARPIAPPSQLNPACPAALDAVILRALATAPAERWPSCAPRG